jgi:hypothetical protein
MMERTSDIVRVNCTEADELKSHLHGISVTATPLHPGRYTGRISGIDLGDVRIEILRSAPVMMLGAASSCSPSLMQVFGGAERARWNGEPIAYDSIAVLEGDRQHAAIYPEDFACTVLGFRGDAADRTAKLGPDAARPRVVGEGIRTVRDARFSLAAIGRAFESAIATNPTTFQDPEVRRSLHASLLETAHGLLSPADDVPPPATRDGSAHQRLVQRADEYLRANPARPVYTQELCAALGTSATQLQQVFSRTFGSSPHTAT